ncbi:hypothetical protein B0H10DRAFT_2235655 [Mycena sp. CBHHK59/15]|nr:hypothetical protein B0H10DRAFT_2235655 [Mycena sp. CBHHK59/15]
MAHALGLEIPAPNRMFARGGTGDGRCAAFFSLEPVWNMRMMCICGLSWAAHDRTLSLSPPVVVHQAPTPVSTTTSVVPAPFALQSVAPAPVALQRPVTAFSGLARPAAASVQLQRRISMQRQANESLGSTSPTTTARKKKRTAGPPRPYSEISTTVAGPSTLDDFALPVAETSATITVGILPKVLWTSDINDPIDLSPRYHWGSGQEIELAQRRLQRANLVFTVEVSTTGPIFEEIDVGFESHCLFNNIDYAPVPSSTVNDTPNGKAWVLTGPKGRSGARTWVEDPKLLTRFTFTLQALRALPFSYTPNNIGEGLFIFIDFGISLHPLILCSIPPCADPIMFVLTHALDVVSSILLFPPSRTIPLLSVLTDSEDEDIMMQFPEAEATIEEIVRQGFPPVVPQPAEDDKGLTLITDTSSTVTISTHYEFVNTYLNSQIVTRSVRRQRWQDDAAANTLPISNTTPFVASPLLVVASNTTPFVASPLLAVAMGLAPTSFKDHIISSDRGDDDSISITAASVDEGARTLIIRNSARSCVLKATGLLFLLHFLFIGAPIPASPFLFSTLFDGRKTASKFDSEFLSRFVSPHSFSLIKRFESVPLEQPLYISQLEECVEYQYLVNIPDVDPSLISVCRSREEHDGICGTIISFVTLGSVDIENHPDFLSVSDGFNVAIQPFGDQDRIHHLLEWFETPCRELLLVAYDRRIKSAADILAHLEFCESNPEENIWGENDEIVALINRFFTHYLTEPGHPADPDQVISALTSDIADADALLRANLFLSVVTGSSLLPLKPTWKVKWLLGLACCAHQGQLILLDYFRENKRALTIAEDTTGAIGWVNSHERVRDVFEEVQAELNGGSILAYLMANLTRWTTHSISFNRLQHLKAPTRQAAIIRRNDIIAAQVGAEKNKKKRKKMEDEAKKYCDLFDNPSFWKDLQTVADDIEPICYITNINQGEKTRADQVLLGFAGVYLHFKKHTDRAVATGMIKRIEKRWAAMDQGFFIMAMVLNPYERISRFGDQAGVSVFTLRTILIELYKRIKSRPPSGPLTPEQQATLDDEKQAKEAKVSQAFLKYMGIVGVFANFDEQKEDFRKLHGNNPVTVWEVMLSHPDIRELADFAILILGVAVNQGGNELDFSDFKIKRTRLRNRLTFEKTGKMSKVGASIRREHVAAGFVKPREGRKNHDESRVAGLIAVPQYADILENESESEDEAEERVSSRLVNSRAAWRKVYTSWAVEARLAEMEAEESDRNSDDELNSGSARPVAEPPAPARPGRWLPCPFSRLFGGVIPQSPARAPRKAFTQQQLLMELLAAEHSEEEPDDGELEGSGDDYE